MALHGRFKATLFKRIAPVAVSVIALAHGYVGIAKNSSEVRHLNINRNAGSSVIVGLFDTLQPVWGGACVQQAGSRAAQPTDPAATTSPQLTTAKTTQCQFGQSPVGPCCLQGSTAIPVSTCADICTNWVCETTQGIQLCAQCRWVQGQCTGCMGTGWCSGTCQ
jgi:hypothetical protein